MRYSGIRTVTGLVRPRTGWSDGGFPWLLLGGCLAGVWIGWFTAQGGRGELPAMGFWLSVVLYYPLLEEMLFRGLLQGELRQRWPGTRRHRAGLSVANGLVSVAFIAMHLLNHSPAWALAVGLPSLAFGYYRDRSGSILYPVILHSAWNGFFFLGRALSP